jgi:hypothetical protein
MVSRFAWDVFEIPKNPELFRPLPHGFESEKPAV